MASRTGVRPSPSRAVSSSSRSRVPGATSAEMISAQADVGAVGERRYLPVAEDRIGVVGRGGHQLLPPVRTWLVIAWRTRRKREGARRSIVVARRGTGDEIGDDLAGHRGQRDTEHRVAGGQVQVGDAVGLPDDGQPVGCARPQPTPHPGRPLLRGEPQHAPGGPADGLEADRIDSQVKARELERPGEAQAPGQRGRGHARLLEKDRQRRPARAAAGQLEVVALPALERKVDAGLRRQRLGPGPRREHDRSRLQRAGRGLQLRDAPVGPTQAERLHAGVDLGAQCARALDERGREVARVAMRLARVQDGAGDVGAQRGLERARRLAPEDACLGGRVCPRGREPGLRLVERSGSPGGRTRSAGRRARAPHAPQG